MKLSEIKSLLSTMKTVEFVLENGDRVPAHFHITEVGLINKHFIDCGGTVRMESNINFQLWNANDLDHRLDPSKLLSIIKLSESKLNLGDFEIEVEYQLSTIGKFGLTHNGSHFVLTNKQRVWRMITVVFRVKDCKLSAMLRPSAALPAVAVANH